MQKTEKPGVFGNDVAMYWVFATLAIVFAVGAVGCVAMGLWESAFYTHFAASAFRLLAGRVMIQMIPGDPATIRQLQDGVPNAHLVDPHTVNAWNNKYHRVVVIALNVVVGFVLLGRLAWDTFQYHTHVDPFSFLGGAVALYFISAQFTRPNTFGARVRSATLTVVLLCTMAYLAWPGQWGLWVLAGVIALSFAILRLRTFQRRFGWADRQSF